MRPATALAAAVVAAALAPAAGSGAVRCPGGAARTTARYRLVLRIRPRQPIYTAPQARRLRARRGQIVLRGTPASAGASVRGPLVRYVELWVCSRRTGAPVAGADPGVSLAQPGSLPLALVVAPSLAVGAPAALVHYGGNIRFRSRRAVSVEVTVAHERAVFRVRPPG